MSQFLSPIANDQIIDANGNPLFGGQIETYLAGSSSPATTYTSSAGTTQHANPIVLNSLGYAPNPVWLTGGIAYKFIIKDVDGVVIRTIDNISGINDSEVSQSQWVESGLTPTYIDATSFSVPGDQTTELHEGRRLKTQNTSGFIYSTIDTATFDAGVTTLELVNDSGTLDAGLSSVAYGLISSENTSLPFTGLDAANTVALTDDGTTNSNHYLVFSNGTAGQEALLTDQTKLIYNPATGDLSGQSQVGDVKLTARNTAPPGWLKANGAAVSRTTYAALYAAIGTTYGVGNGSTTFNLPDLRGEFIRGWDDSRGVDSGRAFGSNQKGTLVAIDTPVAAVWGVTANVDGAPSQAVVGADNYTTSDYTGATLSASLPTATGIALPGDAAEGWSGVARPRNVALLAVIKY